LNGVQSTYRFLVRPKSKNDPRSSGYLADVLALGISGVDEIECCDLYFVRGELNADQIRQLADQLLHDPVTHRVETDLLEMSAGTREVIAEMTSPLGMIEVALRPGVTDPTAEQIMRAAGMIGITTINAASTGLRFFVKGANVSESLLRQLAERLFANAVIQRYALGTITPMFTETTEASGQVETIQLHGLDPDALLKISTGRRAALNLDEMQTIQSYCIREQRDLTDIEFEMLAQTWSEHCVHKTFKARVSVEQDETNPRQFPEEYSHLFNQTIRAATRDINAPWVLSSFRENAGIIEFDGEHELSFKVETHNHPSAIEPFGGANTGIGGVIRDVIGVSAKPIASTDILCFGPQDIRLQDLPEGVLHPRRIASGVVAGIEDYGNKMGIPTVNGAIWYDPGYTANPLVFCGSVGMAPRGSNPHGIVPGDHIILLGGKTGRDGLRGATFSSMTMDAQTGEVSGASVQIGAPIVEKGLVDVLIPARDHNLYHAITDCGAGGLSSAVGEMVSETGGDIQLADVPLKYPGLVPWEIWLSEAQERMVVAVPNENLTDLQALCDLYEVSMTDIGTINDSGRTRVFFGDKPVLDLDNQFLHHGLPQRHYQAKIQNPRFAPGWASDDSLNVAADFGKTLLQLLAHPNIASKERVIRVYDHEVQGGTVVKPLCGIKHDGPSDGSVIKPIIGQGRQAFVLSAGLNPEYGKEAPYEMTQLAIDEAVRNAVACGADPSRIAILDNFCWGDPTRPEIMGDLVQSAQACYDTARHYHTPFISGKDSFNNEYLGSDGKRHAIPPTLLISAMGWMPDWEQSLTMDLKRAGNLLFLVGEFQPVFGGSHYNLIHPEAPINEGVPVCSPVNPDIYGAIYSTITRGLVASCHDLSEGGLAVAAAEMCMGGRLGARLDLIDQLDPLRVLFGETGGCLLVEVSPVHCDLFYSLMGRLPWRQIGMVESNPVLHAVNQEKDILSLDLSQLLAAWKNLNVEGKAE
jgi:phosphoribosylformylglycinamidine synthase subunit PurSL